MTGFGTKIFGSFLLTLILFIATGFDRPVTYDSKIVFSETTHDFGIIREGDIVTYTFSFTNEGPNAVHLISANAACGCTTPSFSSQAVQQGNTGYLKISFNSEKLPGKFHKRIVVSLDQKPYTVTLYIEGTVLPKPLSGKSAIKIGGLTFSDETIYLGNIHFGSITHKKIKLQNSTTYPIRIESVESPDNVEVSYPHFDLLTGDRVKIGIAYQSLKAQINHSLNDTITFITNDSLNPHKSVYLTGYILPTQKIKHIEGPAVTFIKDLVNPGDVIQNDSLKVRFKFKNSGNRSLTITKLIASCGCTQVKITKKVYKPGETGVVNVIIDTNGKTGFIQKEIRVVSNAENDPEHLLVVQCNVIQHPSINIMTDNMNNGKFLIFKGKCRTCHVNPGKRKMGAALYQASCRMCHGTVNRNDDEYHPGVKLDTRFLESISKKKLFKMISKGTSNITKRQMMPGFLKENGGPLSVNQVHSLVKYLKSIQLTH
jgi:hypothetical protein